MADDTTPHGENEEPNAEKPETAETDWQAEARKWEKRSKENLAIAKANEDAARRLAEIEEAQKSEADKAAERVAAAEKRAAELEMRSLRAEVAAAKGVPANLLSGATQEELEAAADALLEFRGEAPKGPVIPTQSNTPQRIGDSKVAAFAEALGI